MNNMMFTLWWQFLAALSFPASSLPLKRTQVFLKLREDPRVGLLQNFCMKPKQGLTGAATRSVTTRRLYELKSSHTIIACVQLDLASQCNIALKCVPFRPNISVQLTYVSASA